MPVAYKKGTAMIIKIVPIRTPHVWSSNESITLSFAPPKCCHRLSTDIEQLPTHNFFLKSCSAQCVWFEGRRGFGRRIGNLPLRAGARTYALNFFKIIPPCDGYQPSGGGFGLVLLTR